jgi:hypothetical protein
MTRTSNIIPLHTAEPFPWEQFVVIDPPRPNPEPAMFRNVFIFLCALAVVVGTLWGFSH